MCVQTVMNAEIDQLNECSCGQHRLFFWDQSCSHAQWHGKVKRLTDFNVGINMGIGWDGRPLWVADETCSDCTERATCFSDIAPSCLLSVHETSMTSAVQTYWRETKLTWFYDGLTCARIYANSSTCASWRHMLFIQIPVRLSRIRMVDPPRLEVVQCVSYFR